MAFNLVLHLLLLYVFLWLQRWSCLGEVEAKRLRGLNEHVVWQVNNNKTRAIKDQRYNLVTPHTHTRPQLRDKGRRQRSQPGMSSWNSAETWMFWFLASVVHKHTCLIIPMNSHGVRKTHTRSRSGVASCFLAILFWRPACFSCQELSVFRLLARWAAWRRTCRAAQTSARVSERTTLKNANQQSTTVCFMWVCVCPWPLQAPPSPTWFHFHVLVSDSVCVCVRTCDGRTQK